MRSRPGAGVDGSLPRTFTYDVSPAGEVAVRGGDPVHAVDGDIGHIKGLVMDEDSRQVAYVLVQTGRLLCRRNVTCPGQGGDQNRCRDRGCKYPR